MPTLYIMCGLAFSGKSTLAREIADVTGSKIVAFDKLWIEEDKKKIFPKNAEGWKYIRKIAKEQVFNSLKSGNSVVYDDNNIRREHRDEFRNIAKEAGAVSKVIYLETPLKLIQKREKANKISQKRHMVESKNFQKVLNDLEIPTKDENTFIFKPESNTEIFLESLKI